MNTILCSSQRTGTRALSRRYLCQVSASPQLLKRGGLRVAACGKWPGGYQKETTRVPLPPVNNSQAQAQKSLVQSVKRSAPVKPCYALAQLHHAPAQPRHAPAQLHHAKRKYRLALVREHIRSRLRCAFTAVPSSITAMQGKLKAVPSSLTAMQGKLKAVPSSITAMQGKLKAVPGSLTAMQGKLKAVPGEFKVLKRGGGGLGRTWGAIKRGWSAVKRAFGAVRHCWGTIRRAFGAVRPGWRGGLSSVMLSLMLLFTAPEAAAGGIAVFDGAALSESIRQRVMSIEQWARDNLNQAEQIARLTDSQNILSGTQELMDKNYAMEQKQSWQQVTGLQQDSLLLLHAAEALWDEVGSAQQYYAAFHKAQAWAQCFTSNTHSCSFGEALRYIEESKLNQALKAYEQAEQVAQKLQEQIKEIQALSQEGAQSQSQAGTLDALAKINGSVAASMVDLNAQVSLLTKLQSHNLAQESNERLAQDAFNQAILKYQPFRLDPITTTTLTRR